MLCMISLQEYFYRAEKKNLFLLSDGQCQSFDAEKLVIVLQLEHFPLTISSKENPFWTTVHKKEKKSLIQITLDFEDKLQTNWTNKIINW